MWQTSCVLATYNVPACLLRRLRACAQRTLAARRGARARDATRRTANNSHTF